MGYIDNILLLNGKSYRYHNLNATLARDVHITFSSITFVANLILNFVILSSEQFRKQVGFCSEKTEDLNLPREAMLLWLLLDSATCFLPSSLI